MPLNEEHLARLEEQIRVEIERKAVEQEALEEVRRLRVTALRRARVLEDVIERYAHLSEQVVGLIYYLQQQPARDEVTREWFESVSDEIDQIKQVLILLLAGGQPEEEKKTRSELKQQRRVDSLKRQLQKQYQNLNLLEEQRAAWGAQTPLNLLNEISIVKEAISRLELEIAES
jgi:hypothetical protein